ncbi:MAG: hypothetical protein ACK48F_00730 [Chryseotalea sp.]
MLRYKHTRGRVNIKAEFWVYGLAGAGFVRDIVNFVDDIAGFVRDIVNFVNDIAGFVRDIRSFVDDIVGFEMAGLSSYNYS